jgi:hypothetical protein
MVKASIEVSNGTARFRVAVQAQSVERALRLVAGRYPSRACRVEFPTGGLSVQGLATRAGMQPE